MAPNFAASSMAFGYALPPAAGPAKVNASCSPDDLSNTALPNMIVPSIAQLRMKKVRSFGDLALSAQSPLDVMSSGSDEEVEDLMVYKYKETARKQSLVEKILLGIWDEKQAQGLFRYDVLSCPSKTLPGTYQFVAQLNEGRAQKKRATEFEMTQVVQDFDASKFNFQKAKQNEVLFQFEVSPSEYSISYEDSKAISHDSSFVYINVSPIEYGHVLLVPRVLSCLPQQMCEQSLLSALHMSAEVHNPCFKLGFNTLGAYATINHLHFQGYFLRAPFPVERAPTEPLSAFAGKADTAVVVSSLQSYPVRGLVFEVGDCLEELAAEVSRACRTLERGNVPYNLLVVDCGQRVFLLPQRFERMKAEGRVPEKVLATGVNPAAFEIGGHVVLKRREDYESFCEADAWEMLSCASLSQHEFEGVVASLLA